MPNTPVLEVKELFKSFGDIRAVAGLNFSVYKGDIYGLLGVNGSGKSTTIRMLLTLISPDRGDISMLGYRIMGRNIHIKRRIGALIENPDFYNYLTAYKNLEILLKYSGIKPDRSQILEILNIVGLSTFCNKKVGVFSHGMKQRLGIAQAMMHDPEIIILDEPANGLDPHGMIVIRNLILKLNKEFQKTIILSSHILKEIELIANRMLIIHEGKAVAEGTVDELLKAHASKVRIIASDVVKAYTVLQKSNYGQYSEIQGSEIVCHVKEDDIPGINRLLVQQDIDIGGIIPVKSLEDYFISLT